MTDQGKGTYVAFVSTGDWTSRHPDEEYITSVNGSDGKILIDFDSAVAHAEKVVREGHSSSGVVEVVELAVTRRAVVKRAVEVSIQ